MSHVHATAKPTPTTAQPARSVVVFGALFYFCFVVYGSLVPLHFVAIPLDKALSAFRTIPFLNLGIDSRADWVANVLLFLPLSFLCNHLATHNSVGIGKYLASLAVLLTTIGLAFTIEFTQLYFPQRTVSQNDIWAESLGSALGIVCQLRFKSMFDAWLEAFRYRESSLSRLTRTLHVYLGILLAFSVLPLDLTISPIEIYHKWSNGLIHLVPFQGLKGIRAQTIYETLTDILIWVPVGLLWSLEKPRRTMRVVVLGLLAATLIELAQLFVYSMVTDLTDVLLACIGVATGATLAGRLQMPPPKKPLPTAFWWSLWWFWSILMPAIFWFPYAFDTSQVTLLSAQAKLSTPLLANYYFGTEYHATNELLRKMGLFLPGGMLWVGAFQSARQTRAGLITGAIALGMIAFLVEAGQLLLPHKYADLSDMLIMMTGGLLGMAVTRWVLSGGESTLVTASTEAIPIRPLRVHGAMSPHSTPAVNPCLTTYVVIFLAISSIAHLPSVPYNVRELIAPGLFGILSVAGLSFCILWQVVGHDVFLRQCDRQYGRMLFLPLWLVAHGCVSWVLLRLSVPLESIHDIVGTPVLGWVWESELIARFLALNATLALQVIGATILVAVAAKQLRAENLVSWMAWTSILAWPLYWVVVINAATDNLTELMRDGGSFVSSAFLAVGLLLLFLAGSCISYWIAYRPRFLPVLLSTLAALVCSVTCRWFGTEPIIVKYGTVFSAWQFLLSTNRDHYVSGASLLVRFLLCYCAALFGFSFAHRCRWKRED